MSKEMFDGEGRSDPGPSAAELEPASQDTLEVLLEEIRQRCPTHLLGTGSGGVWIKGAREGDKRLMIDLYYYGDHDGPMVRDIDGSMRADTTGVYRHFQEDLYYDTSVRASLRKVEESNSPQAVGGLFTIEPDFTSYEIKETGEELDIRKRVYNLAEMKILVRGQSLEQLDEEPIITPEERAEGHRQEDELGLSSVSEKEACDLIELFRSS